MKLNNTALAKGESTPSLRITQPGRLCAVYAGDLDNETLSMEASLDNTNWGPFYPGEDATAQESWSDSGLAVRPRVFVFCGDMYLRWTMSNGAGTPAGVYVLIDGENGDVIR